MRKERVPFVAMTRLLRGYEMNGPKLGAVLHCAEATARKKITNPGCLTLEDIYLINTRAEIPMEELRAAMGKWKE